MRTKSAASSPGFAATALWAASLLLSASAVAATPPPGAALGAADASMRTSTDGYGMVFSFWTGRDCRLEMVFDGPELTRHLRYLQTNKMVSKDLTPAVAEQEPDVMAFSLGQRATAAALPGLVKNPDTDACDVLFQVIHTPLSSGGLHTLLLFKISSAQAQTFRDHVPGLSEI